MSLCLRNIPNKFTPFVNTRKQVTKIDRRLPKHVKTSSFLEEFLNIPAATTTYTAINHGRISLNPVPHLLGQYSPVTYFDVHTEWSNTLDKKFNYNKQQSTWMQEQRKTNIHTVNKDNAITVNEFAFNNNSQRVEPNTDHSRSYMNKSCLSHNERLSVNRDLVNQSCLKEQSILHTKPVPNVQNADDKQPSDDRKPTETQLKNIFNTLREDLPDVFARTINYTIYTEDMIFINNFKGTVITGIHNYLKQVLWLRLLGHLKFAYVKLEILKITMHPEDSSIKVRWRIVGISGTRVFLTFWMIKAWDIKNHTKHSSEGWYDGFSTFYVNNNGKVFKHVADKMMPDQSNLMEKLKTPVAAKLALFLPLLDLNTCHFIKSCSNNELT
ncbi:uncharacterized protein LOC143359910 [Halictus rubicundus]|uniref:uncharacterized protein LOC143359910 n=1 Tax=Halictus rubicundus TaxID=77578 RepID=UPI004034FEAD